VRVLWLNHRGLDDPRAGGAETTIREVGTRLRGLGVDFHLLCGSTGETREGTSSEPFPTHRFSGWVTPHLVERSVLREIAPDIVVDDLAHVVPWFSPQLCNIPGIAFFRHLHRRTLLGQVGRARALSLAAVERLYFKVYESWPFVTEGSVALQDLVGLGVPPGHCRRITPGVDTLAFHPGERAEEVTLLYFGGMRRYKRPADAVSALAHLLSRGFNCKLIMVGDGPELGRVRNLAARLGTLSAVQFLGRLTQEELANVVSSSWINLHTSVAEGWGYSIMEAAAGGVPTVAYRVPGVTDAIVEGRSGVTVTDGDPRALADGVLRILPDVGSFSTWARGYAETCSWDRCAQAWRETLHSVLATSN